MEDKRYYVPELKEFHVGFEFEDWDVKEDENWVKRIVSERGFIKHPHCENRVKYLDREDIESLGFKFIPSIIVDYKLFEIHIPKKPNTNIIEDWWSLRVEDNYRCQIYQNKDNWRRFFGIIKNKSELIKVMEMLNIKKKVNYEKYKRSI